MGNNNLTLADEALINWFFSQIKVEKIAPPNSDTKQNYEMHYSIGLKVNMFGKDWERIKDIFGVREATNSD